MAYKTIQLKLHNLSSFKKRVIDEALENYTKALQYLLDLAEQNIDEIKSRSLTPNGDYNHRKIESWVNGDISESLNKFGIQAMKDSLKCDFGSLLSGYLGLKKIMPDTPYPSIYKTPEELHEEFCTTLEDLTSSINYNDLIKNDKKLNKIISKQNRQSSIFFCRYSPKRNYCLLYNPLTKKFYAKLYLINSINLDKKEVVPSASSELLYVTEQGGKLECTRKKEQYLLVPLAFGKYQNHFLQAALENPSTLKTAILTRVDGEYFLNVNIEYNILKVSCSSYMGIFPGEGNILAYCLADKNHPASYQCNILKLPGTILKSTDTTSNINDYPLNRQQGTSIINLLANEVVSLACKSSSQVILSNPTFGETCFSAKNLHFFKSPWLYGKFVQVLDHKLEWSGLPISLKVKHNTSVYECPICGTIAEDPLLLQDTWICNYCGYAKSIDLTAAINLAMKVNKYHKSLLKVDVKRNETGTTLTCKLLNISVKDSIEANCLDRFWEELKSFSQNYFKDIEANLVNKKTKKLYGIAKKIHNAKIIHEVVRLV